MTSDYYYIHIHDGAVTRYGVVPPGLMSNIRDNNDTLLRVGKKGHTWFWKFQALPWNPDNNLNWQFLSRGPDQVGMYLVKTALGMSTAHWDGKKWVTTQGAELPDTYEIHDWQGPLQWIT